MTAETIFKQDYEKHLQHLKLKGLQPKTIDAYSQAIRRIGKHFSHEISDLSEPQLADYFVKLLGTQGKPGQKAGSSKKPGQASVLLLFEVI